MEATVGRARESSRRSGNGRLIGILLIGAAVAVSLGVYGRVHDPTGRSLVTLVFTRSINLKVWFATIAFALALFQLGSSLRIYGKIGHGRAPRWLRPAHRLSGMPAQARPASATAAAPSASRGGRWMRIGVSRPSLHPSSRDG